MYLLTLFATQKYLLLGVGWNIEICSCSVTLGEVLWFLLHTIILLSVCSGCYLLCLYTVCTGAAAAVGVVSTQWGYTRCCVHQTARLEETQGRMGLVDFQVILQQPLKVFWAGEVVAGHILVNLSETKKMSGIKLRLVGRGEVGRKKGHTMQRILWVLQVHWTESRTRSRTNSRGERESEEVQEHYRATENYLDMSCSVGNIQNEYIYSKDKSSNRHSDPILNSIYL